MDNKHLQAIPERVIAQAQDKINEVKLLLAPYMIALTPSERMEMPKMGEKTIGFVEKAYDFARENPNLVPAFLDMEALAVDFADAHGLWTLANSIRQLNESINDTELTAGSEAFQALLLFYRYIKMAAEQDIVGAKAIYEELKTRFPGGKRKPVRTEA